MNKPEDAQGLSSDEIAKRYPSLVAGQAHHELTEQEKLAIALASVNVAPRCEVAPPKPKRGWLARLFRPRS